MTDKKTGHIIINVEKCAHGKTGVCEECLKAFRSWLKKGEPVVILPKGGQN